MKHGNSWKTLSTKTVYQNKWMRVREDKVLMPSGEKGIYGVVEKVSFVVIIPFIGDKIVLVRQYRYPVQSDSWEFPSGGKDKETENMKKAALRELQEETGLLTNNLMELGTLWLAPGHHSQHFTIFVAKDCKWGKKNLDNSEGDMRTKLFTLEELKEMVEKEIIKDSQTVAGLGLYLLRFGKRK